MCRLLLDAKPSFLNVKDSNGRTALFTAAWNGIDDIVGLLLDEYRADVELSDADGWTPLHAAYDSTHVTGRLLKAGASPDARNNDEETALYVALSRGFPKTASVLLAAGASPIAATSTKNTPLHAACRSTDPSFDPFILACLDNDRIGAGSIDAPNHRGHTPLSLAVMSGRVNVAKLLLGRQDVNVNQTDKRGASLLRHAFATKNIEMAKELLKDSRLTNLDLALRDGPDPESSADAVVRGVLGLEHDSMAEFIRLIAEVKPEICKKLGSELLFEIAMALDDNDLIGAILDIRPAIAKMQDEYGWPLAWIQYVNDPKQQVQPADASGFDFKTPVQWLKPELSGLSLSRDGEMSVLSFSGEESTRSSLPTLLRFWREIEPNLIRSDCPIPPVGSFIFTVEVLDEGRPSAIGFGVGTKFASKDMMPGWESHSWGYHGDDGKKFHGGQGTSYSSTFGKGDTVKCRVDQSARTMFFTKNVVDLGEALNDLRGRLYPVLGIMSHGAKVATNFTWEPPALPAQDKGDKHDGGITSLPPRQLRRGSREHFRHANRK